MSLFTKTIDGWEAWGAVYTDRMAFAPLVRAIYAREGMSAPDEMGGLTPGTNAVFRCGDTVVKIFAPPESGFESAGDFAVERAMLHYAREQRIPTSDLLASGLVEDRYCFRYMILQYVEGMEAGSCVSGMQVEEKARFAKAVREMCDRLHQPREGLLPARTPQSRSLPRLPESLRGELMDRARRVSRAHPVVCHGDLTGENVLVAPGGSPVMIDFADSVFAPACYELPATVFELFRCDPALVLPFLGDIPPETFLADLLDGLSLHAFGPEILLDYAKRSGIPIGALRSLDALAARLRQAFFHRLS